MSERKPWKPPYSIESKKVPSKPGCWDVNEVTILGPDGQPVHKYNYNYSMKPPFYPFELGGQWYALYATDYTASRIMRLPDGKDIWGEKRDSYGFCPVEFYVPAYQETMFGGDRTNKLKGTFTDDPDSFHEPGYREGYDWTYTPVKYLDIGFSCGCVWGDDTSWKVQFFDFSEIAKGKVTYDARFGYFELHQELSLAQSVKVWGSFSDREDMRISLTGPQAFRTNGKPDVDPA